MRTIPVGKSIPVNHYVTTYDHLTDIIRGTDGPIVMHECICRKMAGMKGEPCKKTSRLETCMALGDVARNSIRMGKGRIVSQEEALDIAGLNESDGLVLTVQHTKSRLRLCVLRVLLRYAPCSQNAAQTGRLLVERLPCFRKQRKLHRLWSLCRKVPGECSISRRLSWYSHHQP